MSARVLVLLGCLLAALPASGAAQDARLRERLTPEARARVIPLLEEASAERLPTEPLVQKALEGASRGAEAARIAEAVRELADRLLVAREALGAASTEAELVAGASALYVGLAPEELRSLRRRGGASSLALPLVVLADLAHRGVPTATAASIILSMVEARVPGSAYTSLRQSVAQDIRLGATPDAAATTRAEGLLLQRRPGVRERLRLPGRPGAERGPPLPRPRGGPGAVR